MKGFIRKSSIALLSGALAGVPLFAMSSLAAYPDRAVHLVIPYSPGGGVDVVARIVAKGLSEKWGQAVIVDNKAGASGTIAPEYVSHQAADGYTISMIANGYVVTPSEMKLTYDPIKSFEPITTWAMAPDLFVANPAFAPNSLKDVVAMAKAKPSQIKFGTSGIGESSFLNMSQFARIAGIKVLNVPYKGGGDVVTALLTNEVDMSALTFSTASNQVMDKRLKALAVSTPKRSSLMPNIPTVNEAIGQEFDVSDWVGAEVVAGTPKPIITKLHDDMVEVLRQPEVQKRFKELGWEQIDCTPDELRADLQKKIDKWSAFLKTIDMNSGM